MLVKRIKCHIRNTDSSSTGFRKVGPRGNSDFSFFFPFPLLLHYARAETKKEKEEEGYEYPILVGGRKILLSISKEDTHVWQARSKIRRCFLHSFENFYRYVFAE